MYQFRSHFMYRVPTWVEATDLHPRLAEFAKGNAPQDSAGNQGPRAGLSSDQLGEVWDGLTNQLTPDANGNPPPLGDVVNMAMPPQYAPLMVIAEGIIATFMLKCVDAALTGIDVTDSIAVADRLELAWAAFRKRRRQAAVMHNGLGQCHSQGFLTLQDIEEIDMSEDFADEIERIANLAGRMFDQLAPGLVGMEVDAPMEVDGATTGGDLDRLMPSEVAKLAIDETSDMQTMEILQETAQETEVHGHVPSTGGPLLILVDESGSMTDSHRCKVAGRNSWAKACAVTLARIALAGGREVRVLHFGDQQVLGMLPAGDNRAMFEMARSFLDEGTCIPDALARARREVAKMMAEGFGHADVVLLTDGTECDRDGMKHQVERLTQDGVDLWTVAIGQDYDASHPLRTLAKHYVFAEDSALDDYATATDLAGQFVGAAMADGVGDEEDEYGAN